MKPEISFNEGTVWWNEKSTYLGETELYRLFEKLGTKPGQWFHYDTLKELINGPLYELSDNALQAKVTRLRKRLRSEGFDGIEIDGSKRHHYRLLVTRPGDSMTDTAD